MVTRYMLHTQERKKTFWIKKITDCSRSNQMPETGQKKRLILMCTHISELPSLVQEHIEQINNANTTYFMCLW